MTTTILLTGASGYIGGSFLTGLLELKERKLWSAVSITALVRSESQAAKLCNHGVKVIVVPGFDHVDILEDTATRFDVIIHAGSGTHTDSAKAFLRGLAIRRKERNRVPAYFQISGTSNLSDRPWTAKFSEARVFSDDEDIYTYEQSREALETYRQRRTDIAVVETGEALGVPTYILMAPTIFGLGTGLFNRFSVQLPAIIHDALRAGHVKVIGDGHTLWTHVHIADFTDLLIVLLDHILLSSEAAPSGRRGIYFCESGDHSHLEVSQRLLEAGIQLGLLKDGQQVQKVSVEEAADAWAGGERGRVELSFGANARCRAVLARKLGWNPRRGVKWNSTFLEEFQAVAASQL